MKRLKSKNGFQGVQSGHYEEEGNIGAAIAEAEEAFSLISILENACFDGYARSIREYLDRLRQKS